MSDFNQFFNHLMQAEGGYVNDPVDRGGETFAGVSSKYYPQDVKNLIAMNNAGQDTTPYLRDFYKREFWDKSDAENVPEEMRMAYADTAVNSGIGKAKELLNGSQDVNQFLDKRQNFVDDIISNDPSQIKYQDGWGNRIDGLRGNDTMVGGQGDYELSDEELAEIAGVSLEPNDNYADISDEELMQIAGIEPEKLTKTESFGYGVADGASGGLFDELTGLSGKMTSKLSGLFGNKHQENTAEVMGSQNPDEVYNNYLENTRADLRQASKDNPWSYGGGQVFGAVAQGAPAVKGLSSVAKLGKYARNNPLKTASVTGGISGGVYGFNSGEGDAGERLKEAGITGMASAVLAPAGARAVQAVGDVVKPLISKANKAPVVQQTINEVAENVDNLPTRDIPINNKAISKVRNAIEKDFPDNSEQVLKAWLDGDQALVETYGSRTRTLAQGAAQYKSGKPAAQKYFDEVTQEAPENMKRAVAKNISGVEHYYKTADDILEAGQKRASKYYDRAYQDVISDNGILTTPEIQSALNKAYKQYPSKLADAEPNSIKALDYAKRVLDDDISKAMRAGEKGYAKSRIEIKQQLLEVMDAASPDYKMARAKSGDYLKITNAMDNGKNFMSIDPELLTKAMAKSSDEEKLAFKIGVGKQIRDKIESKIDGSNPYNSIFGSKTQRSRLAKILSPEEFKNLERSLKAENRLYLMRNEILGGSPTAGKQQAAAEIAASAGDMAQLASSGGVANIPSKTLMGGIKRLFDGISEDTAEQISKIIYETNPEKKLQLFSKISKSKKYTKEQKEIIKKGYFMIDEALSKQRLTGATATAPIANQLTEE